MHLALEAQLYYPPFIKEMLVLSPALVAVSVRLRILGCAIKLMVKVAVVRIFLQAQLEAEVCPDQ